jgi:hypothetical protein
MASDKINPDDLNISVDELNRLTGLLGGTVTNESTVDQAWLTLIQSIKARKEASQNLKDAAISATRDLIGVADNLSKTDRVTLETANSVLNMTQSFSQLLNTVPYAGKLLSAGLNALTEVEKFQNTQLSSAYTQFEKLSDYGILNTFEDLRTISATTGLSFDDISTVFTKNSETLAKFGKSVVDGTKNFSALSKQSADISFDFQRIGLSAGEVADMQLRYIERQAKFGKLKNTTDAKNIQGTKDYILLVDELTKITGKTREEVQKELDEQAKDVQAVVGLRDVEDSAQKEITRLIETFKAVDPEMAKGFGQAIYSNALQVNDYTLYIMNTLGKAGYNYQDTIRGLRTGKIKADEFSTIWAAASKKLIDDPQIKQVAKIKADNEIVTKGLRGSILYANKAGMKLEDIRADALAAQSRALTGADNNSKNISDSVRKMYDVGVQMKLYATGSIEATNRLQYLAKTAQSTSDALYNIVRDKNSLPLSITTRKERAFQAYETEQYGREMTSDKQIQNRASVEANIKRESTAGNAQLRRRNNTAKRTVETQEKNLQDYGKKRDEAKDATARLDKQIAAINQQEQDTKAEKQLEAKWGPAASAETPTTTPTTTKPTTMPTTTPTSGQGVQGTSAPLGPESTNAVLRAIGKSEGAGSYDIAFGDRIGPGGVIVNKNGWMTAAEWSKGKNLSDLTLREVQGFQDYRNTLGNYAAAGKYGFIESTLFGKIGKNGVRFGGLVDQLGLSYDTKFDSTTQDRLAELLLQQSNQNLARNGIPITPAWQYMSWYVGPGGTKAVWDAVKNGRGDLTVAQAIIAAGLRDPSPANKELTTIRAQDFENELMQRMAKGGAYNSTMPKNKMGGMLTGPSTGYLVELHGDEIIIPANSGSQLTQLQESLGGTGRHDREIMTKLFSMINNNLDSLISVERTNKSTYEKEIIYSM